MTHQVAKKVSVWTFKHLDVAGRLQHVAVQAETLQATTAKLKDDACKTPLLTKTSQASPKDGSRENASSSSTRGQPAMSGGATRATNSTTDGWFDPGANKKKWDLRSNAACYTATTLAVKGSRRDQKAGHFTPINFQQSERDVLSQGIHDSALIDKNNSGCKRKSTCGQTFVTTAAATKTANHLAHAVDDLYHLSGGDL